jgi:hypothetical protein
MLGLPAPYHTPWQYALQEILMPSVTATQSIKELAPYIATSARLYDWNVYGLGYQDEEQKKMEERTRLYTQRQVGKRTPD